MFFLRDRSKISADPLSDVLSLLRPRNVASGAVSAGEGCIAFPAGGGVKFHAVLSGEAWLAVNGTDGSIHLSAGDSFILPHSLPYRLASDLRLPAVNYNLVTSKQDIGSISSWNDEGKVTILSATFLLSDPHADMLLGILPPIAHVRGNEDRLIFNRSLWQMHHELSDPQPGGRLIVEHLATTMLAQTLRAYSSQADVDRIGWLFALADKKIGTAIGAMHEKPGEQWTVEALARIVAMSRTGFAVRFTNKVGLSPMNYLSWLRMHLASDRLANTDEPLIVVAEAFGYRSESAFSKVFKRHMGCSPRQFVLNQSSASPIRSQRNHYADRA